MESLPTLAPFDHANLDLERLISGPGRSCTTTRSPCCSSCCHSSRSEWRLGQLGVGNGGTQQQRPVSVALALK